jgi:hypothetical protein
MAAVAISRLRLEEVSVASPPGDGRKQLQAVHSPHLRPPAVAAVSGLGIGLTSPPGSALKFESFTGCTSALNCNTAFTRATDLRARPIGTL